MLATILGTPFIPSEWAWSQVWKDPQRFRWILGVTPLSNWQVVTAAWVVYFLTITLLRSWMNTRAAPFKLRYVTATHNAILGLWSMWMCVYGLKDLWARYQERGIAECFCVNSKSSDSTEGHLFYVVYIYYLSKFYELFDTVILVLKKKPIIFLHWYHHAIVILMVWSWLQDSNLYGSMGMIANTFIHVLMYYYYFCASLGWNVWFKRYITSMQIIQFTISFILSVPYLYFHFTRDCVTGFPAFLFSMACNGSFLALFVQFYRKNYKTAGGKAGKKEQ